MTESNGARLPTSEHAGLSISFAGCAWGVPYHFGVASLLQQRVDLAGARFLGASSGAIAAVALSCGLDADACFVRTLQAADQVAHRWLGPARRMTELVRAALEDLLPHDAHERIHQRFFASVTTFPRMSRMLLPTTRLSQRSEVIELVLASCYIPGYYEKPARFDGRYFVDGGMRNNQPTLDCNTITVSPFPRSRARAHISPPRPRDRLRAVFPTRASLHALFAQGRRDAARYLGRRGDLPPRRGDDATRNAAETFSAALEAR